MGTPGDGNVRSPSIVPIKPGAGGLASYPSSSIGSGSTPSARFVLTCGPEILMRFAVTEALNRRISDADIYYSMERNMQCAVGMCGHCQLGPAFLCKDGPVFAHRELAPFFRQDLF